MSRGNEPAYPMAPTYSPDGNFDGGGHVGLTIRERFAMAALNGLLASFAGASKTPHLLAMAAREIADALIAELAKEPKP